MHIRNDDRMTYQACETCGKKLTADSDKWRCEKCNKSLDEPSYRSAYLRGHNQRPLIMSLTGT